MVEKIASRKNVYSVWPSAPPPPPDPLSASLGILGICIEGSPGSLRPFPFKSKNRGNPAERVVWVKWFGQSLH